MSPKIQNNRAILVLWKHVIIRRRHWLQALIEVCLPILLFFLLAYARSKIPSVKKENLDAQIHFGQDFEGFDTQDTRLVFAPRNAYTEDIVERVQAVFQLPTNNIQGYDSEDALLANYTKQGDLVYGIVFHNVVKTFNYSIRIYDKGITWQNPELFDVHVFEEEMSLYQRTKFLSLQRALDVAFIEKEAKISLDGSVRLKPMAFPPRIKDSGVANLYGQYLPSITIFSFLFLVPAIMQRVVEEKQSGIKELQKMVGLKDWMLWLGWFFHGIIPISFSIVGIVLLMKVPFWDVDYPPIEYTNAAIYLIFLMLYAVSTICFCFLMTTFTSRPTSSIVIGILVWIFSYFIPSSVITANGSTKLIKLTFWWIPNIMLDQGYKTMQIFEQNEIGVQFYNLAELPLANEKNLRMIEVLILFVVQIIVSTILTIYMDNINPGKYGIRKPFLYPIKHLRNRFNSRDASGEEEQLESGVLRSGIRIRNLTKRFGNHTAVDHLNLDIHKNKINILLGHNGAGKTTVMHMLTGLIDSTSGNIYVNGLNVRTEMDEIRRSLGLCPQHNLLFQDFTVLEHLVFFAMLKGCTRRNAQIEAKELLRTLSMSEKGNDLAGTLSGGMKRKLCLGMALIGQPKVLILDEPTSGMDPESRRAVWDILLSYRGDKTILISTHFLEEADVLGEEIAIMAQGNALCHGAPLDLKKQFHTGYHLTISLNTTDVEKVQQKIESICEDRNVNVERLKSYGKTIIYNLPIEEKVAFPYILDKIEHNKEAWHVENYSLSLTTLEDVFLKTMPNSQQHTNLNSNFDIKVQYESRQTFIPLLKKRMRCFSPRKYFYLFTVGVVGLLFFCCTCLCQNYLFSEGNQSRTKMHLNLDMYGKTSVYVGTNFTDNYFGNVTAAYKRLVEQQGSKFIAVGNVDEAVIDKATKDLEYYKKKVLFGMDFVGQDIVELFYSYSALHSAPISLNLFSNALVKTYLGDQYSIEVTSAPLIHKVQVEDTSEMIFETQSTIIWTSLFPIGIILLLCPFVAFPYEELSTRFTAIEFMSGIRPSVYWLTTTFGDTIILLVQIAIIMLLQLLQLFLPFNIFHTESTFWTFVGLLSIMTVTSLPYVYVFSRRKTLSGGVALFIVLNLFLGLIPFTIVALLQAFGDHKWQPVGNALDVALLILCPAYGYTKFGGYFAQQAGRQYNWQHMTSKERHVECMKGLYAPCCLGDKLQCDNYLSFTKGPDNTFCRDLGLMCAGMIVYLILNTMWVNNYLEIAKQFMKRTISRVGPNDSDTELVVRHAGCSDEDAYFSATLLRKSYNKRVVDIDELRVPQGKCYGFLGVNGAGKTTTFNLLTKQIVSDDSNCSLRIGKSAADRSSWSCIPMDDNYLLKLGYCPQADQLNFTLTGRELLTFIAEIRGVSNVASVVKQYIEMFDLQDHQDKPVKTYSGGNKRKVCIAIAFLGIRDVVLLDEPTNGVDAGSKRKFWNILKAFQYNMNLTTILTSHSMNECEALCDNLIIMKDATINKNATISELKKEISGYTIILKLASKPVNGQDEDQVDGRPSSTSSDFCVEQITEELQRRFKDAKITEQHVGMVQFHVKHDSLGEIFREVEDIKSRFPDIEDYSISESSVEDIFLRVARGTTEANN